MEKVVRTDQLERLRTISFFNDDIERLQSGYHYRDAGEFYTEYIKKKIKINKKLNSFDEPGTWRKI